MRKVALVFVLAVLLPSLVLAWLAVRSLRDQQFLLERQQSLLDQRVTDTLAQNISDYLAQRQQEFSAQVENLAGDGAAQEVAAQFDNQIRQRWPLAEVGFCVTLSGKILSPAPNARPEAQSFYYDNKDFLGNREAVEVYGGQKLIALNGNAQSSFQNFSGVGGGVQPSGTTFSGGIGGQGQMQSRAEPALTLTPGAAPLQEQEKMEFGSAAKKLPGDKMKLEQPQLAAAGRAFSGFSATNAIALNGAVGGAGAIRQINESPAVNSIQSSTPTVASDSLAFNSPQQKSFNYKQQARKVSPQNVAYDESLKDTADGAQQNLSKVIPAEAQFAQLIGNQTDGMLARFLQNKLKLMFWHRLSSEPDLIFGAQLNLNRVVDGLHGLMQPDPALQNDICIAILDDNARPVAFSRAKFQANWKRPFVATEIGDALPHWEVAAYLADPTALTRAACIANITIGLLIAVLVLAIVIGSWLIVRNLNFELTLARQKTDFVSNVSHELKTPLTSIRMFSELLAEDRVDDSAKKKTYLNIITAEAARLTRLINNVLDFSRMESGEKKYNFQPCDLTDIVRSTVETFRPHLEANGFKFDCELSDASIFIHGDADALSQIIVNLLSNAEKYSDGKKEIMLQITHKQSPLPHAEIKVLDRGSGVPRGSEEKVFEKFYRAHDSLASGIQGSGLGLTIARQIARAHGGDVVCESREGGGSCFIFRLPLSGTSA
ncbi:MAG TPA: HAMP domain-containing sensor histidine kinase [Verrucomicrobiae bacterium]|nr:HAMP domain-containing sensor histidine kinase [Verrucomicrobiae bacterium]